MKHKFTSQKETKKHNLTGIVALCLASIFNTSISAGEFEASHKPIHKIGGNMLSLLALGDLNGSYERSLNSNFSITSTLHYLTTSEIVSTVGTGFRATVGARAYQENNLQGLFLEFKGGYGYYKTMDGERVTGKYGSASAEFYAGYSKRFNENFYYDYKIGAMRLLNTGKILPSAGLSLGINF